MSITKLKWQWQSSAPSTKDLAHVSVRHQYGRVITGMLTGSTDQPEPNHTTMRTSGGSQRD